MKRAIIYISIVATALLLWGCPNNSDELQQRISDFCKEETIGVYNGDQMIFEFDPEEWQIVFAAAEQTSRMQRDDQTVYAIYTLTGEVVENGIVKVSIVSRGIDDIAMRNQEMTVKKIDGNKLWLWQSDKQYGHLIYWEK